MVKGWTLSPCIKNVTRICILITPIQQCTTEVFNPKWKKVKLSFFTYETILYEENPT